MRRHREDQKRTLGAWRISLEQMHVGEGVVSIQQKGVAKVQCVQACSAGHWAENVVGDQACRGCIASVELLSVSEYEMGIIRSWFRKVCKSKDHQRKS